MIVTRSVDATLYFGRMRLSITGTCIFLPPGESTSVSTVNVLPEAREAVICTRYVPTSWPSCAAGACGHVSENGASSFRNRYALHKCNSAAVSPAVPADALPETLDRSWQCFAMTLDHRRQELTGWLNGEAGDRWLDKPKADPCDRLVANRSRPIGCVVTGGSDEDVGGLRDGFGGQRAGRPSGRQRRAS